MTVLRAVESFICPDGSVGTGDLLDSSDPLVKGREHLFEEVKAPQRQDVLAVAVDEPVEPDVEQVEATDRVDAKPRRTRR